MGIGWLTVLFFCTVANLILNTEQMLVPGMPLELCRIEVTGVGALESAFLDSCPGGASVPRNMGSVG